MYFKLNPRLEAAHNNLSQKQLSHQDTPIGIQHSYLKSVQTPQPTCIMALAEGWEPASAKTLFNLAGNGCFLNQSFGSWEIPILWTGFMVLFVQEEVKANVQNLIIYIKKITFWSPFSSWNWGCLWNKLAWEVISLKHRDFHRRVKIFWSLYISEISGTRFNAGITFPTSLCQYLLPLPSGLEATFLSLGFHIGLGLSSSPLDCDLLMSMDAVAFPLAPAGPGTVLFNKRLLYWSIKEHILLLPLEAW